MVGVGGTFPSVFCCLFVIRDDLSKKKGLELTGDLTPCTCVCNVYVCIHTPNESVSTTKPVITGQNGRSSSCTKFSTSTVWVNKRGTTLRQKEYLTKWTGSGVEVSGSKYRLWSRRPRLGPTRHRVQTINTSERRTFEWENRDVSPDLFPSVLAVRSGCDWVVFRMLS